MFFKGAICKMTQPVEFILQTIGGSISTESAQSLLLPPHSLLDSLLPPFTLQEHLQRWQAPPMLTLLLLLFISLPLSFAAERGFMPVSDLLCS